ncbi:hypothetical protein GJ496_008520 [Pomphorhynchus laevis]|nr:hypothetical protein GJ496_008520 [Pomphorhynchus laevis]
MPTALTSLRFLCTSTGETPYDRLLRYSRNSKNSLILPQWNKNDQAFLLKDDRALKYGNSFRQVKLLQSNGHYVVVRDEYEKESAVSVYKLTRIPD